MTTESRPRPAGPQRRPAGAWRRPRWLAGALAAAALMVPALPAAGAAAASQPGARASQPRASAVPIVVGWGGNNFGQVGDGTTKARLSPVRVKLPAGVRITQVREGRLYALALTSAGQVLAWGDNSNGELGDGTLKERLTPVKVKLRKGVRITAVRAGCEHGLALTSKGQILAWGDNSNGQLGDGTTKDRKVPVRVHLPAGVTAKAISAGGGHSVALTKSGHLLTWGNNVRGQLGDGTTTNRHLPVKVDLAADVTVASVSAGGTHNLALTADGQVLAWGDNDNGQLGDRTRREADAPTLTGIPFPGVTVRSVFAGCSHSLALTAGGKVLAWGRNANGEAGDGTTGDDKLVPVMTSLAAGTSVTAISAGCEFSLARTSGGRVLAWGTNVVGELGNGKRATSAVPVRVKLPAGREATVIGTGPDADTSLAITRKAVM